MLSIWSSLAVAVAAIMVAVLAVQVDTVTLLVAKLRAAAGLLKSVSL
jgi:hypothetical protein